MLTRNSTGTNKDEMFSPLTKRDVIGTSTVSDFENDDSETSLNTEALTI